MKAFVHLLGTTYELVCACGTESVEEYAKELFSCLSQANSLYIELRNGNFLVIPERAFASLFFTVEK
ncbi:MAG: hypothetical protein ABIE94_01625 [archaeon]